MKPTSQFDRFLRHVVKDVGCWEWTAYKLPGGHGQFDDRLAHHVSYQLHIGPVPAGMRVVHTCDNKGCVNPSHLTLTDKPARRGVPRESIRDKFARHVAIRLAGCWAWNGSKHKFGYGFLRHGSKTMVAHRVSYELFNGPIPAGKVVRHSCDNPECTNPDHLELGSQLDNVADTVKRGRHYKGDRHHCVKITENDLVDIRVLLSFGMGFTELGRVYGVRREAVRRRVGA